MPRSFKWAAKLPDFDTDSRRPGEQSPSPGWTWLQPGKAIGRILGRCLPPILHLAGTKYWPDYCDRILILMLEIPMGERIEDPFSPTSTRAKVSLVTIGMTGSLPEGVVETSDDASVGGMAHLHDVYWTTASRQLSPKA